LGIWFYPNIIIDPDIWLIVGGGFIMCMRDLTIVMWVKQCHKPPMTGNGKHATYKNGVFPGGWWIIFCYPYEIHGGYKTN
jgi:hypothetical protein